MDTSVNYTFRISLLIFLGICYWFWSATTTVLDDYEIAVQPKGKTARAKTEAPEAAPTPKKKAKKTEVAEANILPNDTPAPADVFSIPPADANEYIKQYAKIAQVEQTKYGIPASITIAQGLVESKAGNSFLAIAANNHFGIKCFSRKCKTGHCINRKDDTHKDFFKTYPNPWQSFRDHSLFLRESDRYKVLFRYGTNYKKWAVGLQNCGYATSDTYAEKLISLIENYKLYKYD